MIQPRIWDDVLRRDMVARPEQRNEKAQFLALWQALDAVQGSLQLTPHLGVQLAIRYRTADLPSNIAPLLAALRGYDASPGQTAGGFLDRVPGDCLAAGVAGVDWGELLEAALAAANRERPAPRSAVEAGALSVLRNTLQFLHAETGLVVVADPEQPGLPLAAAAGVRLRSSGEAAGTRSRKKKPSAGQAPLNAIADGSQGTTAHLDGAEAMRTLVPLAVRFSNWLKPGRRPLQLTPIASVAGRRRRGERRKFESGDGCRTDGSRTTPCWTIISGRRRRPHDRDWSNSPISTTRPRRRFWLAARGSVHSWGQPSSVSTISLTSTSPVVDGCSNCRATAS